jgi:hypothetical protein
MPAITAAHLLLQTLTVDVAGASHTSKRFVLKQPEL